MSESTTAAAPAGVASDVEPQPVDGAAPVEGAAAQQAVDWEAEAAALKEASRKWESRAKANKQAADERDALRAELDRVKAEASEVRAKAEKAEREQQLARWKDEVAADMGVPARALRGDTLEDLTAHGEVLKEALAATRRGPYVPNAGDQPAGGASPEKNFLDALFGKQ